MLIYNNGYNLTCFICKKQFIRRYRMKHSEMKNNRYLCSKNCVTQNKILNYSNSIKKCSKCKQYKKTNDNFRKLPCKRPYKLCNSCVDKNNKTEEDRKLILKTYKVTMATYKVGISYENYLKFTLKNAQRRAKEKNREFDLDYDFLIDLIKKQNFKCAISKFDLTWFSARGRHKNLYNISLDRIDSNKGYTKDNVHIVCYIVNSMKNSLELNKFIEICNKISEVNNERKVL